MNALAATRPGALELERRPVPDPGPGEVLVRIACAGICHTDAYVLHGGHATAEYPLVPGHEASGTIVGGPRDGERVALITQLGCGKCPACRSDRVGRCPWVTELGSTRDGGWQEYVTVPNSAAVGLRDSVSLLAAALIEPAANAHAAVRAARIEPGESVAVLGPGTIGLLVAQCAHLVGAGRVVLAGLESDGERLAVGRALGVDETLVSDDLEGPFDVAIVCADAPQATATALSVIGRGGRVIVEGYAGSAETVPVAPDTLTVQEQSLQGVRGWRLSDFHAAHVAAATGALRLEELVTHRYRLERHADALSVALGRIDGAIKVVFEPEANGA